MISSVCVYVCTSIIGSRGRGIPIDLTHNYYNARSPSIMQGSCYHITRSEERQGHNCSNKELLGPGRGNRGWVATELCLNMTTGMLRQQRRLWLATATASGSKWDKRHLSTINMFHFL